MSLPSLLMSGADCGPVNPLSSLTKHATGQMSDLPGSSAGPSNLQAPGQGFRQSAGPSMQNSASMIGPGWEMEKVRRDLEMMRVNEGTGSGPATFDPLEFERFNRSMVSVPQPPPAMMMDPAISAPVHAEPTSTMFPTMSMGMNSFSSPMFHSPFYASPSFATGPSMHYPLTATSPVTVDKGKGKMVVLSDKDWEAEFAKFQEDVSQEQKQPGLSGENKEQEQWHSAEELVNLSRLEEPGAGPDIEKGWDDIQRMLRQDDDTLAEWEKMYGSEFANQLDIKSDDTIGPITSDALMTLIQTNAATNYPFSPTEEFKSSVDPYLEAVQMMDEGRPLRDVAAALEEACRRDAERGEAWELLGKVWAMDEKESLAIKAFERAVLLNRPDAWVNLAISYVNEGADFKSFAALERWLAVAYPAIASNQTKGDESANPWAAHQRLIDLYIEAARVGSPEGGMDKLVQVGLGVLFYTNSDYQKAKDCFEAALSTDTQDYALWNRMGATLANGGEPELAIDAYRKALELRPTFTRAIYNLGVSCLNINCPHEAAEHLLAALELQKSDVANSDILKGKGKEFELSDDGSENLWTTLRKAFLSMGRHDLADRAHVGGDIASFRKDGFDF